MAALTEKTEILEMQDPKLDGVTFSSTHHKASTVTIDFVRWLDMGRPAKIVVTITPAGGGSICTCGPGREAVAHDFRNEPHYAGCPRWGTPLPV